MEIRHFCIAFVGPVGSGCSTAAELIIEEFKNKYKEEFECHPLLISPAKVLKQFLDIEQLGWDNGAVLEKRQKLQEKGNELRKKDPHSTAKLIIQAAVLRRKKMEFKDGKLNIILTVVSSLKNRDEVQFLRGIYQNAFMLVGVNIDEQERFRRMVDYKGWEDVSRISFEKNDAKDRRERDSKGDIINYGQQVEDVFLGSDFTIINYPLEEPDRHGAQAYLDLKTKLSRVLDILFANPFLSPTRDEIFMHEAWAASCRSLCLSRQVGASIADREGAIISVGYNDAPKFGGGLYVEGDKPDCRCARCDPFDCRNNTAQREIIDEIWKDFSEKISEHMTPDQRVIFLNPSKDFQKLKAGVFFDVLVKSPISDLLEFSRSVHAEMEALMSAARKGSDKLVGSSLYVTTMPCHLCARHILAAGIHEVIFIEPYYKSKAAELHGDAIMIKNINKNKDADSHSDAFKTKDNMRDKSDKVLVFRQYEGVAPRRCQATFLARQDRKEKNEDKNTFCKIADFDISYLPNESKLGLHGEQWVNPNEVNVLDGDTKDHV